MAANPLRIKELTAILLSQKRDIIGLYLRFGLELVEKVIVAFGLDLGGLSTNKTSFVRADRFNDDIYITIFENHPFLIHRNDEKKSAGSNSDVTSNNDDIDNHNKNNESKSSDSDYMKVINDKFISSFDDDIKLFVDVPIDIEKLISPENLAINNYWELTKRPVDKAFEGLPPLADKIGSMVLFFRYLLKKNELYSGLNYASSKSLLQTKSSPNYYQ